MNQIMSITNMVEILFSAALSAPLDISLALDQWRIDPTFLNIQVDLYSILLGLNQESDASISIFGDFSTQTKEGNRLEAARGLARLAAAFRDSSRLYSHIPLVVSSPVPGLAS